MMCRLVAISLLLTAAVCVVVAETMSKHVYRKQRCEREAEEVAAAAWAK